MQGRPHRILRCGGRKQGDPSAYSSARLPDTDFAGCPTFLSLAIFRTPGSGFQREPVSVQKVTRKIQPDLTQTARLLSALERTAAQAREPDSKSHWVAAILEQIIARLPAVADKRRSLEGRGRN